MEPISVSFEVGEAAPGRETRLPAQGADSCNDSPALGLQAKALFRFGRFHSSWKLSGGMFCRETCHPGRAIFSFNSSSFPRKANIPPNLSLPVVTTPEANANLSPST